MIIEYVLAGLLAVVAGLLLLLLTRMGRDRVELLERLEPLDRLNRLERLDLLGRLKGLDDLPRRIDRLEERLLEGLKPPPAPEPAPPHEPGPLEVKVEVADDLEAAVRAGTGDLSRDLKKLLRLTGRTRSEQLRSRVSRRLQEQGYANVRISGGLPRTRSATKRVRIPVDAERDGQRHRGVVVVRGTEVEEVHLSPLHRMFP
jgi:hypothetical protein